MAKRFRYSWLALRRLKSAARWIVRAEEDVRVRNSSELKAWLHKENNQKTYASVVKTLRIIEEHEFAPDMLAIRRAALQQANDARFSRGLKTALAWATIAAAALAICFVGIDSISKAEKPVAYSTGFDGRRVVALGDGSRMSLDASSAASVVHFSRDSRELSLDKGRAHFDVIHDPARPFTVRTGSETIIATGTSFNVERLMSKTFVTVTTGQVVVEIGPSGGIGTRASIRVVSGQQLVATPKGYISVANVNVKSANAWEQGKIILNDEPLDEAVEQINRYIPTPVLVDPSIANIRVSGVFSAGRVEAFVGAVTSYFPVQSVASKEGNILLERRV
jgi:transmembrane sensor